MSRSSQLGELKSAKLSQGTIRYRECGQGEPIVFIAGFGVNGDLWRNVVPSVAGGYRCITPDVPLGAHEVPLNPDADLSLPALADMLVEFLDAVDVDTATLVGNDTGGALVQVLTGRHPERVARMVLTPSDCFERMPPPMFGYLRWVAHLPGAMFVLLQSLRIPLLRRSPMAFGWISKRPIPDEVMDSYLSPGLSSRGVRRDMAKVCKALSPVYTLTAAEQLRHFERPVLLLWPTEDRFFPYAYAERMAAMLHDARLVTIEDSYTFVSEDRPDVVAEQIVKFMRETGAGAAVQAATAS